MLTRSSSTLTATAAYRRPDASASALRPRPRHRGELRQRYRQGQEEQHGALGRIVNAIVLYNTIYTQRELDHLSASGLTIDDADIERLSPLGTDHITLTGRYRIAPDRGQSRMCRKRPSSRLTLRENRRVLRLVMHNPDERPPSSVIPAFRSGALKAPLKARARSDRPRLSKVLRACWRVPPGSVSYQCKRRSLLLARERRGRQTRTGARESVAESPRW
jgi:hypothetical protein